MKRIVLAAAAAVSLLLTNETEARAQGSAQPGPWTSYGSSLFATAPTVWVRFFGADAAYTSKLFFLCDLSNSCQQLLFQNNSSTAVNRQVKLNHTFAIGEEIIFKLFVTNTNDTWYSGGASRNADNVVHFATQSIFQQTTRATYTVLGGFEDLSGGGDRDYNDLMFAFSNVTTSVTSTPEPATMALMATGLAGLGGFARRRRRSRDVE